MPSIEGLFRAPCITCFIRWPNFQEHYLAVPYLDLISYLSRNFLSSRSRISLCPCHVTYTALLLFLAIPDWISYFHFPYDYLLFPRRFPSAFPSA